ncbi:MAG TPA: hypothetical protein VNN79_09710 [Actinomycetota bacterium]|nr:hypothetical protein [Actinomycetota bacterium]
MDGTREAQGTGSRPRASKRRLRVVAGLAAGAAFALPWAVIRAVPLPPKPNAVILPAGAVVVVGSGHAASPPGSTAPNHAAGKPVSVTRGSGAPPP